MFSQPDHRTFSFLPTSPKSQGCPSVLSHSCQLTWDSDVLWLLLCYRHCLYACCCPAKLMTYLWSQYCSFYLLADSAVKQSPIQQIILRNNVGNLYLRPLWPIYFGHNHFADPKVLQPWKSRQLKSHFLRKPESTHSPPISIFQSFFQWAMYPGKPWPSYLLCRSRYPDHQTSQSLMHVDAVATFKATEMFRSLG